MSSYGLNSIRGYFDEKQFKGNELIQFGIMMTLAILLIVGGVFILQGEDIFKKIYEGFATTITVRTPIDITSTRWTATLPEDLTLGQLQKNVSLIRKKSQINIYTGYTMIATGSIISLYQIYNLFF